MKEIKLTIPEGCKAVTVKVDGEQVVTEFEPKGEKWEPKGGDIVALDDNHLAILKSYCQNGFSFYYFICNRGRLNNIGTVSCIRPATEEEKQLLINNLAELGIRWNAEKKEMEKLPRWRAKEEETYYYIGVDGGVEEDWESASEGDDACYSVGNYFKTREAAERVAEQIREIFKNSKAE